MLVVVVREERGGAMGVLAVVVVAAAGGGGGEGGGAGGGVGVALRGGVRRAGGRRRRVPQLCHGRRRPVCGSGPVLVFSVLYSDFRSPCLRLASGGDGHELRLVAARWARCHCFVNRKWFSGILTNWSITKTDFLSLET